MSIRFKGKLGAGRLYRKTIDIVFVHHRIYDRILSVIKIINDWKNNNRRKIKSAKRSMFVVARSGWWESKNIIARRNLIQSECWSWLPMNLNNWNYEMSMYIWKEIRIHASASWLRHDDGVPADMNFTRRCSENSSNFWDKLTDRKSVHVFWE